MSSDDLRDDRVLFVDSDRDPVDSSMRDWDWSFVRDEHFFDDFEEEDDV